MISANASKKVEGIGAWPPMVRPRAELYQADWCDQSGKKNLGDRDPTNVGFSSRRVDGRSYGAFVLRPFNRVCQPEGRLSFRSVSRGILCPKTQFPLRRVTIHPWAFLVGNSRRSIRILPRPLAAMASDLPRPGPLMAQPFAGLAAHNAQRTCTLNI